MWHVAPATYVEARDYDLHSKTFPMSNSLSAKQTKLLQPNPQAAPDVRAGEPAASTVAPSLPTPVAPVAVAPVAVVQQSVVQRSVAVQREASPLPPVLNMPVRQAPGGAALWPRVVGWGLLAVVMTIAGAAYGAYAMWARGDRIAPGVSVQGENIGGLSAVEARRRLTRRFNRLFVEVKTPTRPYRLALRELGGKPMIDRAVKNAYWYGRSGSLPGNMKRVLFPGQHRRRLSLPVRWDKARLRRAMWTVASNYRRAPRNAVLLVNDAGVQVVGEQMGRSINVGATLKQLQKKYYVGRPQVDAAVRRIKPRLTAANLAGTDIKLGEYPTRFDSDLEGRTRNIQVAAAAINGKVLMPGQNFSFNEMTGERTWDKGYRMAHIFETKPGQDKAEVVDGLAGGVCQVSSTLFNAVRRVNRKIDYRLKITERNTHSLPVSYVPSGLDATVAWPDKDFKFRNTLPHPVYLRTAVHGSRLRISLWGRVPQNVASIMVSPDAARARDDERVSIVPQRHARAE